MSDGYEDELEMLTEMDKQSSKATDINETIFTSNPLPWQRSTLFNQNNNNSGSLLSSPGPITSPLNSLINRKASQRAAREFRDDKYETQILNGKCIGLSFESDDELPTAPKSSKVGYPVNPSADDEVPKSSRVENHVRLAPFTGISFESDDEDVSKMFPNQQKLNKSNTLMERLDMDFNLLKRSSRSTIEPLNDQSQIYKRRKEDLSDDIVPKIDYCRIPTLTTPFETATATNGSKLYIPLSKMKSSTKNYNPNAEVIKNSGRLLSVPMFKLMRDAREQHQNKTHQMDSITRANSQINSELWVDKYKPRLYVDLVGDERVHRSILNWVKNWDYCVFKKEVKRAYQAPLKGSKFQKKNHEQSGGFKSELQVISDRFQRPEKRILMIAGPPGLGKTTMAHVIAEHCGYNVIEINAR